MRTRLVHFEASDGVSLPALLFEPRRTSDEAVVFLHGNGDSSIFYSRRTLILAEQLTRAGIAFFPFNNRGAHLLKSLRRRHRGRSTSVEGGTAHELIRDAVPDIEGALHFLRASGYRRLHLVGHSTGANKIAVFNSKRPRNSVISYTLLAGGDDSGFYRQRWGIGRFRARLLLCRLRVSEGRGHVLVPPGWSPFPISFRSLLDTINPDGDYNVFPFLEVLRERVSRRPLFRLFRAIRKPTLVLYGAEDEYCYGDVQRCVSILAEQVSSRQRMLFGIMPGAGHGFGGKEVELGKKIVAWVRSLHHS